MCMKAGHHKCVLMHAGKYTQPNTQSLPSRNGCIEAGCSFSALGPTAAAPTAKPAPICIAAGEVLRVCDGTLTVPCEAAAIAQ